MQNFKLFKILHQSLFFNHNDLALFGLICQQKLFVKNHVRKYTSLLYSGQNLKAKWNSSCFKTIDKSNHIFQKLSLDKFKHMKFNCYNSLNLVAINWNFRFISNLKRLYSDLYFEQPSRSSFNECNIVKMIQ